MGFPCKFCDHESYSEDEADNHVCGNMTVDLDKDTARVLADLPKDVYVADPEDRNHLDEVITKIHDFAMGTGKHPTHLIVDHRTYRKILSNSKYFYSREYTRDPKDFERFSGLIISSTMYDTTYIKVL